MTYSLAIGDKTYSSWSLRGWLLFAKFDIPVDVVTARMYSPEFTDMLKDFGGGRLVPAIRFDAPSGPVMVSDTLAIAETLAERHPEKNMWPQDPVARGYARSITAEMHSGFGSLRTDCTMNLRHCYSGFVPSDAVLSDLARIEKIWTEARSRWGAGGPWLFGEYSIADAFYAPIATRLLTYGLPRGALASDYVQSTTRDATFKEWRDSGLAENYVQPGYDLDLETIPWPDS
ncbi:glutathione S-transferase [Rhodobacterales bacterium 52_120_T64]|nr:glutathione S-transferase [Rhodobacterales bacterium 52_120_T64]